MTNEYFKDLSNKPTSSIEILLRYYQDLPTLSDEDAEKLKYLKDEYNKRAKSVRKIIYKDDLK